MTSAVPEPDRLSRPVPPAVIRAVLRYVEAAAGADACEALLTELPPPLRAGDVVDPHRWSTREEAAEVVTAAARLCGDAQFGRRVGGEELRASLNTPFAWSLVAAGSVEGAFREVAARSGRMSLGRSLSIVEAGDRHLLLESSYTDPAAASRFACDFTAGYLSQVPLLFGQLGTTVELACRSRGGERCLFRVAWRPDPTRTRVDGQPDRVVRSNEVVDWFEEAQATAARLAGATDVDELLVEVVQQARQRLHAPQVCLAVRLRGDHEPRVHHAGFDVGADDLARRLADGDADEAHVLRADIEVRGRSYGRIAAVFAPGTEITNAERRMLAAYAGHVASALHAMASLERARNDRDTARALLGLARAFSEVTSVHDVATRLALAMPEAVHCDLATVWLSEAPLRRLRLVGSRDRAGAEQPIQPRHLAVDDYPELAKAMWSRRPAVLSTDEVPAPARAALAELGIQQLVVVPIAGKDEFLGVVAAGFHAPLEPHEHLALLERLRGLTAHASTALQNAEMLERMRHQALHDTLTGLANRTLSEDRGRQALAALDRSSKRVALLFLDLDGFKEVNDTHGHHIGDALIRNVAARLDGVMRTSDTVGRLGGDEFVVVMSELESEQDAVDVARRILEVLERPVAVEAHRLRVSCSIGVASTDVVVPFEDLLRRADAAMYEAKAQGGRRYVVHDGVVTLESERVITIDDSSYRR